MLTSSLAETKAELDAATKLIGRVYARAGYIHKDKGEASAISGYLFSPATRTFMTHLNGELIGTLSVVLDSPQGLPMEDIFKDELNALRAEGKSIGESCQFAIDRELLAERQKDSKQAIDRIISLVLFKLAIHYSMRTTLDVLCIAVNPKHEAFYRWMGFVRFGETKEYPSVENAPAVPMQLDMQKLKASYSLKKPENWLMSEIFADPIEERVLAKALLPRTLPAFLESPTQPIRASLDNQ